MAKGQAGLKLNFSSSPTVAKFFNSKGFVRGLMGPTHKRIWVIMSGFQW